MRVFYVLWSTINDEIRGWTWSILDDDDDESDDDNDGDDDDDDDDDLVHPWVRLLLLHPEHHHHSGVWNNLLIILMIMMMMMMMIMMMRMMMMMIQLPSESVVLVRHLCRNLVYSSQLACKRIIMIIMMMIMVMVMIMIMIMMTFIECWITLPYFEIKLHCSVSYSENAGSPCIWEQKCPQKDYFYKDFPAGEFFNLILLESVKKCLLNSQKMMGFHICRDLNMVDFWCFRHQTFQVWDVFKIDLIICVPLLQLQWTSTDDLLVCY